VARITVFASLAEFACDASLPVLLRSSRRKKSKDSDSWHSPEPVTDDDSAREAKTAIRATEPILYERERNEATSRRLSRQK